MSPVRAPPTRREPIRRPPEIVSTRVLTPDDPVVDRRPRVRRPLRQKAVAHAQERLLLLGQQVAPGDLGVSGALGGDDRHRQGLREHGNGHRHEEHEQE